MFFSTCNMIRDWSVCVGLLVVSNFIVKHWLLLLQYMVFANLWEKLIANCLKSLLSDWWQCQSIMHDYINQLVFYPARLLDGYVFTENVFHTPESIPIEGCHFLYLLRPTKYRNTFYLIILFTHLNWRHFLYFETNKVQTFSGSYFSSIKAREIKFSQNEVSSFSI